MHSTPPGLGAVAAASPSGVAAGIMTAPMAACLPVNSCALRGFPVLGRCQHSLPNRVLHVAVWSLCYGGN